MWAKIDWAVGCIKCVNKMLSHTVDSRCLFVCCLVLLHIALLSIPTMLGVYTMVAYFQMTNNTAIAITVTIITAVVQYTFINIKSSVMLYDNMTKQIQSIE
jgi:hypothetical protein